MLSVSLASSSGLFPVLSSPRFVSSSFRRGTVSFLASLTVRTIFAERKLFLQRIQILRYFYGPDREKQMEIGVVIKEILTLNRFSVRIFEKRWRTKFLN